LINKNEFQRCDVGPSSHFCELSQAVIGFTACLPRLSLQFT
jgi:hypothetical protein